MRAELIAELLRLSEKKRCPFFTLLQFFFTVDLLFIVLSDVG